MHEMAVALFRFRKVSTSDNVARSASLRMTKKEMNASASIPRNFILGA